MEDNSSYTYTYEKNTDEAKPERSLKLIFAGIIAALAVLAVVLGIFFGVRSANKPETTTEAPTTETPSTTVAPMPKSPYNPGKYSVNTNGRALLFRKDHSKDADTIFEIADLTELEITEIFHDEFAESDDYMYWGKAEHLGHTGWVAMKYMKKAYSDNVVTPDDITSVTEDATENTTADVTVEAASNVILPPPENTTAQTAETTEVTTTTTSTTVGKYSIGDYKVSTGGVTLSFRKTAGTSGEKILDIPNGENISIVEIVDTASSDEKTRYWGRTTYKGYSGYVCMTYLSRIN